ncbi:MAG: LppX_LprAFG lipoprotein [Actinomycetota bacterium]
MGRPGASGALAALARAAAIAVSAALLAAGCGDGGGGPDRTAGLTPGRIVAVATDTALALRSVRVDIDARADTRVAGATGAAALFAGPVELSAHGRLARPKLMSIDVELTAQGFPIQGNLTRVGDSLYLTVLGRDFRLGTPAAALARTRPERMPAAVLGWLEDPRVAGREDLDGTPTVHVAGRLGAAALTDLAGQLAALTGGSAPVREDASAIRRGTADAWIGREDLLVRRVVIDLAARGPLRSLPDVTSLTLAATLDFSAFDARVEVTAPAGARPLDLDDLGPLLGR